MRLSLIKIICTTCLLASFGSTDAGPWCVEFRTAYFRPSDREVRDIYSEGWADYQVELSRMFYENWALWGSINWYRTMGHATCCGDVVVSTNKTSLSVVPLSLGLEYYFPIPQLDNGRFYLGAGASVAFVRVTDDSEFVKQRLSQNGAFGGVLKSGMQYFFQSNLFVDLFADYVFQPIHFKNGNVDVKNSDAKLDGVKLGVGLGLNF